jgi:hypothetical protein
MSWILPYRKQPDLQAAVSEIAEGNTNADLVQDLNDLAVLGRNNPEPLLATNFNPDLLPQAPSFRYAGSSAGRCEWRQECYQR